MHANAQLVAVVDELLHRFAEGFEERRFHGAAVEHMGSIGEWAVITRWTADRVREHTGT